MGPRYPGDQTEPAGEIYGIAALSLLEALILVLADQEVISEEQLDEAFVAAIDANRNRHADHSNEQNKVAAKLLERLRVRGNSVRLD